MSDLTKGIDALLLAKENLDIEHIGSAFPDGCVCGICDAVRKQVEQAKREELEGAAKLCCSLCHDGYERARGEHLNRNGIGNIGICRANNIHLKLAEGRE